jgi:hypothetical protein
MPPVGMPRPDKAALDGLAAHLETTIDSAAAPGFRSYRCLEIALYHTLGQIPEPEATHRFC